jgi:hypothetical protein
MGRLLLALLLAIPAGLLGGIIAGLVIGGGETGGTLTLVTWLVGILVFTWLFRHDADHVRDVLRRGLFAIGLEAFLLPLTGLIFSVVAGSGLVARSSTAEAQAGAAVATGVVATVLIALGFVLALVIGVPCLIAYFALRPAGAPETRRSHEWDSR